MLIQKGELTQNRSPCISHSPWGERETEAASASHGRGGKPKTPVGQLSVPSERRQKSPCLALTYPEVASLALGLPGPLSPSLLGTAWEKDRRTDRQTDCSVSLSGHHTGDGQMDRQTTLHRSPGITWVTDGRTNPGVSGRPDGQTAARCPASSRPRIVCPQAPSCGRCSLEELKWESTRWRGSRRAWIRSALPAWESSRGGRAGTCWHPDYPALPPSA